MLHRPPVHVDPLHALRVDIGAEFSPHRFNKHNKAGYLNAAARAARASADKHQHHQNRPGRLRPQIKIHRGKTRGRDDRRHLKRHMTQTSEKSHGRVISVDQYDTCGGQNHQKVSPHFLHAKSCLPFFKQKKKIHIEIHAKQKHKNRRYPLNVRGIPGHTVILNAKAPRTRRTESRSHRIKYRHAAQKQQHDLHHGQKQIDLIKDCRRMLHLRYQLAHGRPRTLRPHQVHVRSPGHLDHCQQKHQHAHAAQPMGKAPPEQHTIGQTFHLGQHTGARRGKAGDRLKQCVRIGGDLPAQIKRKRPRDTEQNPPQSRGGTPLFHIKHRIGRLFSGDQHTGQPADGDRNQKAQTPGKFPIQKPHQ